MPRSLLSATLAACLLALPAAAQQAPGLEMIFNRMDADGDGRIAEAELAAQRAQNFARADRNADGSLSAAEVQAVQARLARFTAAMADGAARMDRNADGLIARDEFLATPGWFRLLDSDGDGTLSRAEAERAQAALAE
jgi:Ca2+-binding EF-hand superfamily protein